MPIQKIMRRSSSSVASKGKNQKKHVFSEALRSDPRIASVPRRIEVVHQVEKALFFVKIYANLEIPGSELMTVSCVDPSQKTEVEMRFDERYPISIQFRTQTD